MKYLLYLVLLFFGIIVKAQPGALDLSFSPQIVSYTAIRAIALQPDGKILAGVKHLNVHFTITPMQVARMYPNGTADTAFNNNSKATNAIIRRIIVQPDGKILFCGDFDLYDSIPTLHMVRLNDDGTLDTSFHIGSGFNAPVYALALQTDGKIVAGGLFTEYNGTPCNRLARLNADGSYDTTFNTTSAANGTIEDLAIQPDGKIVIGGDFTAYDGAMNVRVARVNTNGSRDTTWVTPSGAGAVIHAVELQPDGKILLGGNFVQYNLAPRYRAMRLLPNGDVDALFYVDAGANAYVYDIAITSNDSVLIGGAFTTFKNTGYKYLVKTNSGCIVDTTYNNFGSGSSFNDAVYSLVVQPDGKILAGGQFTEYNGSNAQPRIARLYNCLTPQPDSIYGISYAECAGTAQTYYVTPVAGATLYEWTLPNGWTGTSDSAFITAISGGSGGTISVKAFTDSCGYSYATTLNIATVQPPGVDICLVTVNDSSTHNIILWEKPATTLIDSFFIYRETTTNVYTKIGAVPYDSLSEYHDLDTNANPNSTSFRYKLSVLDTCGAESALSPYHSTIHLQNLGNGNFQWTFYQIENAPNPVTSFNMNRDPNGLSGFSPIGLIPGTNATFTDINHGSFPDAEYVIDVNWNISCTPIRATINTTRSNIKRKNQIDSLITGMDDNLLNEIKVYPNPADNQLNIELPASTQTHQLQLINSLGQIVWRQQPESNRVVIDVSNFSKGIYLLSVETENGILKKKIVVQ